MRRFAASTLVLAMSLTGAPLFAAGPAPSARQAQATGSLTGTAQSSQGQTMANLTVRVRNLSNGNLAGSTTSGSAGQFSFAGLNPGNYAIEVVNAAGDIVGTSASVTVTAGATVNVAVMASAVSALGGSPSTARKGGISTAVIVTAVAAAAGVAGVVVAVNRNSASPSR